MNTHSYEHLCMCVCRSHRPMPSALLYYTLSYFLKQALSLSLDFTSLSRKPMFVPPLQCQHLQVHSRVHGSSTPGFSPGCWRPTLGSLLTPQTCSCPLSCLSSPDREFLKVVRPSQASVVNRCDFSKCLSRAY